MKTGMKKTGLCVLAACMALGLGGCGGIGPIIGNLQDQTQEQQITENTAVGKQLRWSDRSPVRRWILS